MGRKRAAYGFPLLWKEEPPGSHRKDSLGPLGAGSGCHSDLHRGPFPARSSSHLCGLCRSWPPSPSILITFPPSLFPNTISEESLLFIFGGIEEGWGETLLSLKMFLLNILILPRHQSLYFPFSPYRILPLRQPGCLNVSEGDGRTEGAPRSTELSYYLQTVSCCFGVVGLETSAHLVTQRAACR